MICAGNFELPDLNAAAHRVLNDAKLFSLSEYNTVFLGTNRSAQYYDGIVRCSYRLGYDVYERAYPKTKKQWASQILDTDDLSGLLDRYRDTRAVLLYNTPFATVLAVRRAFQKRGVRILYDCTEWNGYTEGDSLKRRVKAFDSTEIEKRLGKVCDGVIAVSRTIADQYRPYVPVLLLPPLVDLKDPIFRQKPVVHPHYTFLYAGSPSDKERLDLVIRAFAALPRDSAALRIVGVEQEAFISEDPDAALYAEAENIVFTGRLSHRETVREILSCDCFVFLREPTRRNTAGFPTKFVEASTCGARIICADTGDVGTYADESCTLLPELTLPLVSNAMRQVFEQGRVLHIPRPVFDFRQYAEACRSFLEEV